MIGILAAAKKTTAVGVLAVSCIAFTAACDDDTASQTAASAVSSAAPTTTTASSAVTSSAAATTTGAAADAETLGTSGEGSSATLALLETIPVKGRAPKTGYDRDLFGQAWSDDVDVAGGHNGCDTRNDILRRDLTAITYKSGTRDCVVATGTLDDTYTGTRIDFVRGEGTSTAVQIDHIVALSDAWQKGAQQLDEQTRRNLANDPRNLQAVDGPTNMQKSDGDAATWLPPNKGYRCTYVSRQVEVKAAYGLWVTQAEKDAITTVLGQCGGSATTPEQVQVPATTEAPYTPPPVVAPTTEAPAVAPLVAPAAVDPAPSSVTYANCAAVRAAGAAPILRGEPGYSSKLDRDGDGIGCE